MRHVISGYTTIRAAPTDETQRVRSAAAAAGGDEDLAVNVINGLRVGVREAKEQTPPDATLNTRLQGMIDRVAGIGTGLDRAEVRMNTQASCRVYRVQLFIEE